MSNSKNRQQQTNRKHGKVLKVLAIFGVFLFLIGSGLVFFVSGDTAKQACSEAFDKAYDETKKQTYDQFYQVAFDYFEEQNHVSNRASISIGNIKEENNLEVLSVSTSWVNTSDPKSDPDRTTRWVEFSGTGVYTVDMSLSEFIIDDNNRFVIAKVPTPQLNRVSLGSDAQVFLFEYKKGLTKWNGDYDSGVKMLLEDRAKATQKITEQLENNDNNLIVAKNSTENFIRSIIKSVNTEIELRDDNIRVEFI